MSKASTFVAVLAFVTAGFLCVAVAFVAAAQIEERSVDGVVFTMRENNLDWVRVSADGLEVHLRGTAPDEAERFRALSLAGTVVDADRIVDFLQVEEAERIEPPRFSLEMLRNGDGISLIGLVPEDIGRDAVADEIAAISEGVEVANMVETASYPVPERWEAAMGYALRALRELPRAQISVFENRVEITAVSESIEERERFLSVLNRNQPAGVDIVIDISAPRPVITPFTLRFVRSDTVARFEACSADTEAARQRILRAATAAGLIGAADCDIGIGVPSPQWAGAVETALAALTTIGEGTLTFSDADVTLVAAETTPPALFDQVIGELDTALPEVFSLHGVRLEPEAGTDGEGPANFVATLSPEGYVQLRGRLPDDRVERAVYAYARAMLNGTDTYLATRRDDSLPEGWPVRVLAGLEGLSLLSNGSVTVTPDLVTIRGSTGARNTVTRLTQLLSEKLGESQNFEIDVAYEETLDPTANIPTPEECVARISRLLEIRKITFDPGSVEINETAGDILDEIATMLPDCRHARMEIGGHTDSQGREEMNLNLSQARADAVLNGLLAREVLVSNLTSQGYGETQPIADNDTEEGRERNRRIEFRLLAGGAPSSEEGAQDGAPVPEAEPSEGSAAEEDTDEQN